jgi:hypothetical protein
VNDYLSNPDDFDADDDLPPMDEFEYEEFDGVETAVELDLLLGRAQATRFADA